MPYPPEDPRIDLTAPFVFPDTFVTRDRHYYQARNGIVAARPAHVVELLAQGLRLPDDPPAAPPPPTVTAVAVIPPPVP